MQVPLVEVAMARPEKDGDRPENIATVILTVHEIDDYPKEQLQEVCVVVSALDRGDFFYAEPPRTL